jgi:hypothetical protein
MKVENQLLARLARVLTGKPEAVAPVEAPVEATAPAEVDVVTQAVEAAQAVAEAAPVEALSIQVDATALLAEVHAQVELVKAEFGVQLADAISALAEMTSKFEAAEAALATIAAEKTALEVAAAVAKASARKVQVEAAIGTEKAAGLLLATEGLDDVSFDKVVAALAGSVDAEAKSTLFQEVGATGVVDAAKIVEESAEMKILKAKYPGAK